MIGDWTESRHRLRPSSPSPGSARWRLEDRFLRFRADARVLATDPSAKVILRWSTPFAAADDEEEELPPSASLRRRRWAALTTAPRSPLSSTFVELGQPSDREEKASELESSLPKSWERRASTGCCEWRRVAATSSWGEQQIGLWCQCKLMRAKGWLHPGKALRPPSTAQAQEEVAGATAAGEAVGFFGWLRSQRWTRKESFLSLVEKEKQNRNSVE